MVKIARKKQQGLQKTLDPSFPIMQLNRIFSLNPPCQGNAHIFQTLNYQFVTSFLFLICRLQTQTEITPDNVIRVILKDMMKLFQIHRKQYTAVFTR